MGNLLNRPRSGKGGCADVAVVDRRHGGPDDQI